MKKYIFLLIAFIVTSCTKKEVVISGKIDNVDSLSRIEIIDISSVSSLPISNFGFDKNGNFRDTIQINKDGVYAIAYNNNVNIIYLKSGEDINITGNISNIPEEFKITGKGQSNNEFLYESQKFTNKYFNNINASDIFSKKEDDFIKEIEKYSTENNKKIDEIARIKKANTQVVQWKKDDLLVLLSTIAVQYEAAHRMITHNTDFKVSKKFKEFQKKIEKPTFVKDFPIYRHYLWSKLQEELIKFAKKNENIKIYTEMAIKFLETQKEIDQETKDYLIATIAVNELTPNNKETDKVYQILQKNIKTENIKNDLEKIYFAFNGLSIGSKAPLSTIQNQEGKYINTSDIIKEKPTLLLFYNSSSQTNIEYIIPNLKELTDFYKSSVNFVSINIDDSFKQFQNTSKNIFKDILGNNVYAPKGLKSEIAKQYHLYRFNLPFFTIIDKDGKIASKSSQRIDPNIIKILNKLTGLSYPLPEENNMENSVGH